MYMWCSDLSSLKIRSHQDLFIPVHLHFKAFCGHSGCLFLLAAERCLLTWSEIKHQHPDFEKNMLFASGKKCKALLYLHSASLNTLFWDAMNASEVIV